MTRVSFDPGWQAFDGIFGGYVIARLVRAAEIEGYLPLSISVQFMGAVRPGECELHVSVTHRGSLTAAVGATLVQQHPRASAVVKLGRQPAERIIDERADFGGTPMPEEVEPAPVPYGPYPYEYVLDSRMAPAPGDSGAEHLRGWIRLDPSLGALGQAAATCIALDAPPPGPFFLRPAPVFVPTVDFTAHFAPPSDWSAGDWMYLWRATSWATRDFCLEQASLYTADGRLVAQARQTRRVIWGVGAWTE